MLRKIKAKNHSKMIPMALCIPSSDIISKKKGEIFQFFFFLSRVKGGMEKNIFTLNRSGKVLFRVIGQFVN